MYFRGRPADGESVDQGIVIRFLGATLGGIILFLFEVFQIAVLAIVMIVAIRFFVIKPFVVQGASMEPNFHDADYLIIDEISYRMHPANRGDVVVFHPPGNESQYYIKRVIGLPGETVKIQDGEIWITNDAHPNGFQVHEDYIHEFTQANVNLRIGLDEYFVMGDNRDSSLDSRSFGPVPKDHITGRVWFRGLPISHLGTIGRPQYTFE